MREDAPRDGCEMQKAPLRTRLYLFPSEVRARMNAAYAISML